MARSKEHEDSDIKYKIVLFLQHTIIFFVYDVLSCKEINQKQQSHTQGKFDIKKFAKDLINAWKLNSVTVLNFYPNITTVCTLDS